MQDRKIRITLLQYDVAWENKIANLNNIERLISELPEPTDIVVLPEMCTTGFTFNAQDFAETVGDHTISTFKEIAVKYGTALFGSFLCRDNDKIFNRGFFITSDEIYFYDKRHLFRMGREDELFTAGNERKIVHYKGFNICLQICYDLRFPVWSRNVNNDYDILMYAGNWLKARIGVWESLLKARSIENMCYTVGVNRVGVDGYDILYAGTSMIVDQRGGVMCKLSEDQEEYYTITLDKEKIDKDRKGFPVWKDADEFTIKN